MLTGKDVHEATLFATSDSAGSQWDKLNTFDKQVYEITASVLNGYHIAPLQQQVAGLEQQVEKLKSDIKELRDMDRQLFDEQATQIAALQLLAQDWQQYVKDDDEMDLGKHFESEYEAAQEQRAKLERRTRELCRKEH